MTPADVFKVAKENGAKGLAFVRFTAGELSGGISKFLSDTESQF